MPNFEEDKKLRGMAPHELRKALLRRGMNPAKDSGARQWTEAQLTLQSFGKLLKTSLLFRHGNRQLRAPG